MLEIITRCTDIKNIVDSLYSKINKLILDSHETRQLHITNCDLHTAMKGLKSEKSDDSTKLTSNSIINETDLLFKCKMDRQFI